MNDITPDTHLSSAPDLIAHLHDQIEDEDKTDPKPLPAAISEETKALLTNLMTQIDNEMAQDAQARKDAEVNGTIADCDVPVDQRGHLFSPFKVTSRRSLDFWLKESGKQVITGRMALPDADPAEVDENGECTIITVASTSDLRGPCYWCGENPVATYDGAVVRTTTECPLADGFTTTTELVVTSGKIVVADDMSSTYFVDDINATLNTAAGRALYAKKSAALGCAFAYVGDHGPSLYRTGPDTYIIAGSGHTPTYDRIEPDGERLTDILLDARAYSIADHDDFLTKGGELDEDYTEVVEVPNGVYTFSCHRDEASFDFDSDKVKVFTTITRTDLP